MSPKAAILFVPRPNFGQIDAYIPIAAEIARSNDPNLRHVTIVIDKAASRALAFSDFHLEIISKAGPVYDLTNIDTFSAKLSKLVKGVSLLLLMFRISLAHKKVTILYSHTPQTIADKITYFVFSMFGKIKAFPSIMGHKNHGYFNRLNPELYAKAFFIDTGRQPQKGLSHKREICYFSSEVKYIEKLHPQTETFCVGHPRLLPSWLDNKHYFAEKYIQAEFQRVRLDPNTTDIAVVICTNPEYFWAENLNTYFEMLDEIISSIRKFHPKLFIFLSIKNKFIHSMDMFEGAINKWDNVVISHVANVTLSVRAKLCVSLFESSALFEYVYSNVPCIEYSKYSSEWQELYGDKSIWDPETVILFANNINELNEHISSSYSIGSKNKKCNTADTMLVNYQDNKLTNINEIMKRLN